MAAPEFTTTTFAGTEDVKLTGTIIATDADKDTITYSLVSPPTTGVVLLTNTTGAFSFTGKANWSGTETFVVKATDSKGDWTEQTITINLAAAADAPALTIANATAAITPLTLDGTPDGETLNGSLGKDTLKGGAGDDVINGDGSLLRTVALSIKAATADTDGSEVVTFKVTGVPADGMLSAGTKNPDGSWSLTNADVTGLKLTTAATANYSLNVTAIATESSNGTSASKSGVITVTVPAAGGDADIIDGGDGNDIITGGKGGDTITGGAGDDTFIVNKGDGADIVNDASGNDTIKLGAGILKSAVTYARATNDLVISVSSGEKITVKNHYLGSTVETLQFADGQQVNLGLLFNKAPVVTATTHTGYEDQEIKGQIVATDGDKDKLTYSLVTGPANGTLTLDGATGAFTFAGNANWSGADSFVVKAADGKGGVATQTVKLTAVAVADAPTLAVADVVAANGGAPIAGTIATETIRGGWGQDTITGNAGDDTILGDGAAAFTVALDIQSALVDTDGSETLSVRIANVPADGVLSAGVKNADGSWTLTADKLAGLTLTTAAASDFSLTVTAVAAEIANGSVATKVGTIDVTVPTGTGDADDIDGGIGNDTLIGGLGNDVLKGGSGDDTYRFAKGDGNDTISDSSGYDVIRLGAGIAEGDLTYTRSGSDLVIDIAGGDQMKVKNHFVTGTIEDLVLADGTHVDLTQVINVAPTVNYGSFSGYEDRIITGKVAATDFNGDTLTYSLVTGPSHGTLSLDARTGAFAFNGDKDWAGNDTFTVKVSDGQGGETTKTMGLAVEAVGDALTVLATSRPVPTPIGYAGWQRALDIKVLGDNDGSETLTFKLSGIPSSATLSHGTKNADGTWSLTSADLTGLSMTGTGSSAFSVKIDVSAKEGPAAAILGTTSESMSGSGWFELPEHSKLNFTLDTNGDPGKYILTDAPDHGTVSWDSNHQFTYTPTAGYRGSDSMTVLLDSSVNATPVTLKFWVNGVADAPVITPHDITIANQVNYTGTAYGDVIKCWTTGQAIKGGAGNDTIWADAGGTFTAPLDIAFTLDSDKSEGLYQVVLSSLPIGTTFSVGKAGNEPGTWVMSGVEAAGSGGVTMTASSAIDFTVNVALYIKDIYSGDITIGNTSYTVHVPQGSGIDWIRGEDGNDVIHAGIGDDDVQGGLGDDTIYGEEGDDYIYGGDGKDKLMGGAGDDYINGDAGDDTIYGDDGDDWISTGEGLNVAYGGKGDDFILGGSLKDKIDGGEGDDTIAGYLGDDTIFGGAGDDKLDAGEGNNLVFGGAGNDKITGKAGNDLLYGDAGDDVIEAGDGANLLSGGAGNDHMTGGIGIDKFFGGDGNDTAYGGAGADTFLGDGGNDTLYGEAGIDIMDGGDGSDTLYGGLDADVLKGGKGNDTLDGGAGADKLDGGEGNDTLMGGGDGADTFAGGAGYDTLDYSALSAAISANLGKATVTRGLLIDKVATVEKVIGTAYDDTLTGGSAGDELVGGAGKDTIQGGAGSDTLWGGEGADRFVWALADIGTAKPRPFDTVKDFTLGEDVLDLRGLLAGQTFANPLDAVQARDTDQGTVLSVSLKGAGFVDVMMLEGVHTSASALYQGSGMLLV